MAVIPVNFGQANFRFGGSGVPNGAEVTLGFEHSGSIFDPADAALDLVTNWVATIHTVLPASIVLDSVLVKYGPNDLGPSAEQSSGAAGTGGGVQTSIAVAVLVHKVTALGGRPGRGRMFIPGVQESEVDPAGNLTGAFVSGLQTELNSFYSDMVASGIPPYLLHSETSPVATPTAITAFTAAGIVATQRRRQRR